MASRLKDKSALYGHDKSNSVRFSEALRILIHTPTALLLTIGFSGLIFVLVGYLTWTPTYLFEKFEMSLPQAGFHSMFYTHLCAFLGIILAGKYSDKLARKDPAKRLLMQGVGLLAAVPFIILMGTSNILFMVYIGFAGFGFARAFFDANTYSILYDVIPEKYQSSVSGIMLMIGFSVGSLSPLILGYLKPIFGLSLGLSLLSVVWIFCGILLLVAYKFYFNRDYLRVHKLLINKYN
jgi:sugar phosphate permease